MRGVVARCYLSNVMNRFYSILIIPLFIALGAMIFLINDRPEQKTKPTFFIVKTFREPLPATGGVILSKPKIKKKLKPTLKPYSLVAWYEKVRWYKKAPIFKGKVIEIDLSTQRFLTWQDGILLGNFIMSTGKSSTPTRTGRFKILDHYRMAYGSADGQNWAMPYWMGIYWAGSTENGIHELPFLDGVREGNWDLGRAVSHGCIRLPIGVASVVYKWAIKGTPVIIHY